MMIDPVIEAPVHDAEESTRSADENWLTKSR
jgi:hypothetical protein